MTKKILIVTDNLPDQINGVVTTYKNIEACAIRDGYTVDYVDPRCFRYVDCPGYNEVKITFPWKIWKKIEEINPDHIHIATEGTLGLWARAYLAKHGIVHNTAYHTKFPEGLKTLFGIPEFITWRFVEVILLRHALEKWMSRQETHSSAFCSFRFSRDSSRI